jgi:hypothetical protein
MARGAYAPKVTGLARFPAEKKRWRLRQRYRRIARDRLGLQTIIS